MSQHAQIAIAQAPIQAQQKSAHVHASASGILHRKCACGQHTIAGGECEECRQKREGMLQRAAVSAAPTNGVPPIVHDVLNSPGQRLDAGTRAFMEPRFGHDFSQVRVHTDARAAESAQAVNALAYTVGRNVVFGTGQYAPGTSEGRKLLAHELTHVMQQKSQPTTLSTNLAVSLVDSPLEQEANFVANTIITGSPNKNFQTPIKHHTDNLLISRTPVDNKTLTNGAIFDGLTLTIYMGGKLVMSTFAVSGDPHYAENVKGAGPIPDGRYTIRPYIINKEVTTLENGTCGAKGISSGYQKLSSIQESRCSEHSHYCFNCLEPANRGFECYSPVDCWGRERIRIEGQASVTDPSGASVSRNFFYIHGGSHRVPVTSGCIKVFDDSVFTELRKFKRSVPLIVNKTSALLGNLVQRGLLAIDEVIDKIMGDRSL